MRLNVFAGAFLALSVCLVTTAKADQIENEAKAALGVAPAAVLLKVNPGTKMVEVFKAPTVDSRVLNKSASSDEVTSAIKSVEVPANKIAEFKLSSSELDNDTSTPACWGNWYGGGWGYNNWGYNSCYGNYYGNYYNNYYYPSYFNYGGYYNYNYGYNYGYNNCYYGWYY